MSHFSYKSLWCEYVFFNLQRMCILQSDKSNAIIKFDDVSLVPVAINYIALFTFIKDVIGILLSS